MFLVMQNVSIKFPLHCFLILYGQCKRHLTLFTADLLARCLGIEIVLIASENIGDVVLGFAVGAVGNCAIAT